MNPSEIDQPKKSNIRKITTLATVAFVCVAMIYSVYGTAIYAEMKAFQLVPSAEAFTELYFAAPSSLPASIPVNQPLVFKFTVMNREGVTTTYPYIISFITTQGVPTVLATGTVVIADGDGVVVRFSERLPTGDTRGTIAVTLPSENGQQIDFALSPHS